jgi:hypothetical protein
MGCCASICVLLIASRFDYFVVGDEKCSALILLHGIGCLMTHGLNLFELF